MDLGVANRKKIRLGFAGEGTVIKAQGISFQLKDVPDKDEMVRISCRSNIKLAKKGGTANVYLSPLTGLRDFLF